MLFPYGSNPSDKRILSSIKATKRAYQEFPETTCLHRACCCRAGCPNMYWSEYLSIRMNYIDKLGKDDRLDLLVKSVGYYLLGQHEKVGDQTVAIQKPCLLLDEKGWCKAYEHRPLKCRTYGLVPADMHRRILDEVASEAGMRKQDVPLCVQCPFVKVKPEYQDKFPDNKVSEAMIAKAEQVLREADRRVGIKKKIQDDGYGFLTFHDWHIMSELGETWMETLSVFRTKKDKSWKEDFVRDLKKALGEQNNDGKAPITKE